MIVASFQRAQRTYDSEPLQTTYHGVWDLRQARKPDHQKQPGTDLTRNADTAQGTETSPAASGDDRVGNSVERNRTYHHDGTAKHMGQMTVAGMQGTQRTYDAGKGELNLEHWQTEYHDVWDLRQRRRAGQET